MKRIDKIIFRKPKNKIEEILKQEILKKRLTAEVKKEKVFDHYINKLRFFVPLQVVIGIIAIFLMYFMWGWEKIIETLLSWTIGMTIIATIITSVLSKYHKEK